MNHLTQVVLVSLGGKPLKHDGGVAVQAGQGHHRGHGVVRCLTRTSSVFVILCGVGQLSPIALSPPPGQTRYDASSVVSLGSGELGGGKACVERAHE